MNGATYVNPTQAPPSPYRRSFLRLVLTLAVLGIAVMGFIVWLLKTPGTKTSAAHAEHASGATWKAEQMYEPLNKPAAAVTAETAEKTDDAKWRQQEAFNKMLLALLKQREKQASAKATVPAKEHPKPVKYAMPLFLENKLEDKPATSTVPEYLVGVGSYLPCAIETAINSDVEGHFVANVTSVVWDTETGKHALVPPGSKILGNTQSNKLVFGSERMDTVSLKLRLPTGRDVDLKQAPVTDEQGMAGLTGDINRHLMRIYGAVFITGVLKGGTAAMQSAMSQAAGVNQVAVSVAGAGSQATSRLAGPLIDTRPTIKVAAGQLCQVILLEPLKLPASWQEGAPREPAHTKTSQAVTTGGK